MENDLLLNAIIQNTTDGIITIDGDGTIQLINPAACVLFGYEPAEVMGRNIATLMPQGEKGLKKDGIVFPCRLELNEVTCSGQHIFAGFIRDLSLENKAEDQLNAYALQLEDLVAERTLSLEKTVEALQVAKEELSRSLENEKETGLLKTRFISMASHEFRTPLTSVQLSAYLINKYAEPFHNPDLGKHTRKIKNAVSSINTILSDFLTLEHLE